MKKLQPTPAFYLYNGFGAFNSGLIATAVYVYYVRTIGVTPFQLALISTVHMLTHVLCELPTGIVADVYSRKISVLIGSALAGVCYIITGAVPVFAAMLFATFIEAVGDTFVSGALDAWLTDEVGADQMGAVILRAEQLGTPVHWAGVAASVLLSTVFNHQMPIVLGGTLWLVAAAVLLVLMPETGFVRRTGAQPIMSLRGSWHDMLNTFREGVRVVQERQALLLLFAAQVLIGAFGAGLFGFDKLHLFTNFVLPTLRVPWIGALDESAWIAIFAAANSALYLLGIAWLRRTSDLSDAQAAPGILFGLFAMVGIGALAFALAPTFGVAAAALCLVTTLVNMTEPLLRTWLNQNITSSVRATVLSMSTQVNRLGMLGSGLAIGALGNAAGLRVALSASALLLVPLLALLRHMAAQRKRSMAQTMG